MGPPEVGCDAALRRPIDEPEAEQERLVDVLDRLDLLGQHRGERLDADRPRCELLDDRREQLAIGRVETLVVDVHRLQGLSREGRVDGPVAVDLGVVAHALEQPVHDARGAARAAGNLPRSLLVDARGQDVGRARDDPAQFVLRVEIEVMEDAEALAQGR